MKRKGTIALIVAAAAMATGCQNMGLDYAGPEEEAQIAPSRDLVANVTAPVTEWGGQELVVDGQLWVPTARADLPGEQLRPIGSAAGATVHARSWDRPPYDQLFTRIPEATRDEGLGGGAGWILHEPVVGGGGRDRPRGEAGTGH